MDPLIPCGWCGLRVEDFNHVLECRKTQGAETIQRFISELREWITDASEYNNKSEAPRQSYSFHVVLDDCPGDDWIDVGLELDSLLSRHYDYVTVELDEVDER